MRHALNCGYWPYYGNAYWPYYGNAKAAVSLVTTKRCTTLGGLACGMALSVCLSKGLQALVAQAASDDVYTCSGQARVSGDGGCWRCFPMQRAVQRVHGVVPAVLQHRRMVRVQRVTAVPRHVHQAAEHQQV